MSTTPYTPQIFQRSKTFLGLSQLFSTMAIGVAHMVGIMGYAVYELEASVHLLALIVFLINVTRILGQSMAGGLIDALGPKKVGILFSVSYLLVCLAMQFVGDNTAAFVLICIFMGLVLGFFSTVYVAFVPYVASAEQFSQLNSNLAMVRYGAYLLGPLAAGFVVKVFSIEALFLVSALLALIAAFATSKIVLTLEPGSKRVPSAVDVNVSEPTPATSPVRKRRMTKPFHDIVAGLKIAAQTPKVLMATIILALSWFTWGAFDPLETVYLKDIVGVDVEWLGWVATFTGMGSLLSAFLYRFIPPERQTVQLLGCFVVFLALATMVYIGTTSIVWVSVGSFFVGLGFGLNDPLFNTIIQRHIDVSYIGRVAGATRAVGVIMSMIPYAFVPQLSDMFGVHPVLIGATMFAIVTSVASTIYAFKSPACKGA